MKQEIGQKKKTGGKRRGAMLLALSGLLCIACAVCRGIYFFERDSAEKQMENIRSKYVREVWNTYDGGLSTKSPFETETGEGEDDSGSTQLLDSRMTDDLPEEYDVYDKKIDFDRLAKEQNPDIYAWITIPGTQVDYPVLQHPEELDYYLDYNIDGSKGYPGCIYTQLLNEKNWMDKNTVLYGHNMKNGTMFGSIHSYENSQFFQEHSLIYIYTAQETYVYKIFAAYEYSDVHLLLGLDTSTPELYQTYLDSIFENIGERNQFNTELELTAESRIITLSTCIDGKDNRRWLVQAVME